MMNWGLFNHETSVTDDSGTGVVESVVGAPLESGEADVSDTGVNTAVGGSSVVTDVEAGPSRLEWRPASAPE